MNVWTPKSRPPDNWAETVRPPPGAGFAPGYAARPAFAVASSQGVWSDKAEQPENWTAVT